MTSLFSSRVHDPDVPPESGGDDGDNPRTALIKSNIREALRNIKSRGDFAYFDLKSNLVNPCLHVHGLGVVGLPLSPREAKGIIDVCHRSPFGKGSETLVDTSVRKCWELNSDQFELQNPHWPSALRKMVEEAVHELDVFTPAQEVRAEKYKLLLYEEGAFFLPHEDSPKEDRMFGTMVVCLPSEHEGGEIILTHNGKTHTFATSEFSHFAASCAAWYSDVTHEIKPVTSGYRLVLTYNLIQHGVGQLPKPPTTKALEGIIRHWRSLYDSDPEYDCPKQLVYRLSHKYPASNLGFRSLKGSDQGRILHLQLACEAHGISIWLANVERRVDGGVDECEYSYTRSTKIEDVIEDSIVLQGAVDENGGVVCQEGTVDADDLEFIQPGCLTGIPDEKDCSGFTGNEGVTATHFYRVTVAILIPEDHDVEFRFRFVHDDPDSVTLWLHTLLPELSRPDGEKAREKFKKFSAMALQGISPEYNPWHERRSMDPVWEALSSGLWQLGDFDGFKTAIERHSGTVSPVFLKLLAKCLHTRGLSEIRPLMDRTIDRDTSSLDARLDNLMSLVSECKSGLLESRSQDEADIGKWQTEMVKDILSSMPRVTQDSAPFLIRILALFPEESILTEAKNFLSRHTRDYTFIQQCLAALFERRNAEPALDMALLRDVYKTVLDMTSRDLSLDGSHSAGRSGLNRNVDYFSTNPDEFNQFLWGPERSSVLDWHILGEMVEQSHALGVEIEPLLSKLKSCIGSANNLDDAFHRILIPLSSHILALLLQDSEEKKLAGSIYPEFIRDIIGLYISKYVGAEPPEPTIPEPALSTCGCLDCQCFNVFLEDRNTEARSFALVKKRRDHIFRWVVSNPDLQHETITGGSPHQLYIKKSHLVAQKARADWRERVEKAIGNIRKFGVYKAGQETLGEDFYQNALTLNGMISPASHSSELNLRPLGMENGNTAREQPSGPLLAGQKRPSEEPQVGPSKRSNTNTIDLTQ